MTCKLKWSRWLLGVEWGYNPKVAAYLGPLRLCWWRPTEPATRRIP